ncbi:hypothetical protein E3O82_002490, partial [Enterococcus faecalis]|nr:hypothetical protein [Enterococcus faecalis]
TKEIIENYFLNIGTSYYQSRQFNELKAKWENGLSNTSQFGVGILSCFMIGNEIEVVTRNLYEKGDNLISFKIDGPHENFYYKKFKLLNLGEIAQEKIMDITKRNCSQEYRDSLIYLKENWKDCRSELVEVRSENIYLASTIVFFSSEDTKLMDTILCCPFLARGGLVSIDGMIVKEYGKVKNKFDRVFQRDINNDQPFIINFDGINKPKLSIDRLSITEFSDELFTELEDLIEQLKLKMFEKICILSEDCFNKELALQKMIENTEIFKLDWIEFLVGKKDNTIDQLFEKLKDYILDVDHISDFFKAGKSKVKFNLLFNDLSKHEWMVYLSKILDAEKIELFEDYFEITTIKDLKINQSLLEDYRDGKLVPFLAYADNWDSYFPEYDMVTALYPIVSSNLFELTESEYYNNKVKINDRIKWLGSTGNGLSGMGNLQSVQLIPEFGFGSIPRKEWPSKKYPSRILNFERSLGEFWLFELNSSGRIIKENHKDYVLRAFISPTILRVEEEAKLDNIKEKYPIYYKGVYEGWNVVFLGKTAEIIYQIGNHKSEELLKYIPSSFSNPEKIDYYLINGEKTDL